MFSHWKKSCLHLIIRYMRLLTLDIDRNVCLLIYSMPTSYFGLKHRYYSNESSFLFWSEHFSIEWKYLDDAIDILPVEASKGAMWCHVTSTPPTTLFTGIRNDRPTKNTFFSITGWKWVFRRIWWRKKFNENWARKKFIRTVYCL